MPKIETKVGPLAVRVAGDGPPAVLWHSLFVDERSWGRVEEGLGADRTLVVITGPGHGRSGDPGRRYTMEDCAEAATTVLDELGVRDPVDWVGNAWGGHVGIELASGWPTRCRTLVTVGTPVPAYNGFERLRTQVLLLAYRALGPVGFLQDAVADALLAATTGREDPEAVALVKECLATSDRTGLANAVVSISLRRADLTRKLPSVGVPTLFVTGAEHQGWTPEQAAAASRLLPDGSTAVVPDAAYLAPLENPTELVRLVRDFWALRPVSTSS